nr:hypothetical protein CFP56_53577 [Quercus suber]
MQRKLGTTPRAARHIHVSYTSVPLVGTHNDPRRDSARLDIPCWHLSPCAPITDLSRAHALVNNHHIQLVGSEGFSKNVLVDPVLAPNSIRRRFEELVCTFVLTKLAIRLRQSLHRLWRKDNVLATYTSVYHSCLPFVRCGLPIARSTPSP